MAGVRLGGRSVLAGALTVVAVGALASGCTASSPPPGGVTSSVSQQATATETTTPGPSASGPAEATTAVPSQPAAVPTVLQFAATTVDGKTFRGADLLGRRTVLWFWAPWCTICARNAADVKAAAEALGPDVTVVGVAGLSASSADMRGFVERGGLQGLTHLADTTGDLYARFGVTQQDTYVAVTPDGTYTAYPGYSSKVDVVGLARKAFG
ncbi:MAG: redoxin domain-containing protein [Lapillicoccus sp.]